MSFFGLEKNDLEKDKQNFLEAGLQESEDVAVYTWGEDSYDGLGDALQEGGDELNDETFGASGGNIGKGLKFEPWKRLSNLLLLFTMIRQRFRLLKSRSS